MAHSSAECTAFGASCERIHRERNGALQGPHSMLSINPFAVAGASLPAGFLQGFLVVMALAVVAGTLFDIVHKGSARYFFATMGKSKHKGRDLGGGELVSIAVQTAVVDVLASGEFCNQKR